jgi:hypothetical protein
VSPTTQHTDKLLYKGGSNMKRPIYFYQDEPHFDEYYVGPPCPCPPHHPPYRGKVGVVGRTVLTVRYIDCHGHVQVFDIHENQTYEIKAVSQTKGICTFAARIIDFESANGIEKLLNKPHEINITALIIDYSDAYESKLLRIGIENIISIKPIKCFENDPYFIPETPQPIAPPPPVNQYRCEQEKRDEYVINDPFANNE